MRRKGGLSQHAAFIPPHLFDTLFEALRNRSRRSGRSRRRRRDGLPPKYSTSYACWSPPSVLDRVEVAQPHAYTPPQQRYQIRASDPCGQRGWEDGEACEPCRGDGDGRATSFKNRLLPTCLSFYFKSPARATGGESGFRRLPLFAAALPLELLRTQIAKAHIAIFKVIR
jgi:hypothetical protein